MCESSELLLRSLGFVISFLGAFWVWNDSRRLKASGASLTPLVWVILVFLSWFVSLPAYLLLRRWYWKNQPGESRGESQQLQRSGVEVIRPAEIEDRDAHSRLLRTVMILLVGGSLLLALLTNLRLLVRASSVVKAYQAPWSYVFPLDHPEFKKSFSESFQSYTWFWPPHKIYYSLGSTSAWSFIIVVGLVCWYWYIATRERADSVIFLLPALAPALVGLALAPLKLISMISALAEQGLRNPAVAGEVVGEVTKTVCIGTLLSLICMLSLLWSRTRSGSEPEGL